MVEMCLSCSSKYSDDKEYSGKEWWRAIYKIWEWFIGKDEQSLPPDTTTEWA